VSYFNPKIYNRENLKKDDVFMLDSWQELINNTIDNAVNNQEIEGDLGLGDTLNNIKNEIIKNFCESLKTDFGYRLQDVVVSLIDGYGEDVEEREEFTTYYYDNESES